MPDIKCGNSITVPMGWASGYLAMLVGLGLTICVQSSSITTSALTPLVGIGVLSVERMYADTFAMSSWQRAASS